MESYVELNFGERIIKAFFSNGFNITDTNITPTHRHRYAEVHIVVEGQIKYTVENEECILEKGMALLIPTKKFHNLVSIDENTKFVAFQIDLKYDDLKNCRLSPQIFEGFLDSIKADFGNVERLIPYVYWIISELISDIPVAVKENTDYSYLIYEFFSDNYNKDISVADLARALHISEKQTQRIIKRETGNTFLKELTFYRMKMAEYFVNTTNMPMNEIAEYVGYDSYSGFWKAYNKCKSIQQGK